MTRENVFQDFKSTIETAKRGRFPIESQLIMRGRIDYAVESGDLSGRQGEELIGLISLTFFDETNVASEISSFGDSENKAVPLIRERVLMGAFV